MLPIQPSRAEDRRQRPADHRLLPGFGSVRKYIAVSTWKPATSALDGQDLDKVFVLEVMGRTPAGSPPPAPGRGSGIPVVSLFPEIEFDQKNSSPRRQVVKGARYAPWGAEAAITGRKFLAESGHAHAFATRSWRRRPVVPT